MVDNKQLADMRRDYIKDGLIESNADSNPIDQFSKWFEEATLSQIVDVNAMTLSTVDEKGSPHARIVLLKSFDKEGFVFFTNYKSSKGHELDKNSHACLLFYWAELERQVRLEGFVSKISRQESEAYFQSRPFESKVGAHASEQSQVIASRDELQKKFDELSKKYADGKVPLPENWGGYCLKPSLIEFWQGRASRLHDRLCYQMQKGVWVRTRLSP